MHFWKEVRFGLLFLCVLLAGAPVSAFGQAEELLDLYRNARVRARAAEATKATGGRLQPLSPARLALLSDTLFTVRTDTAASTAQGVQEFVNLLPEAEWRPIRRLQRSSFEEDYGGTKWSYLGPTTYAWVDTVWTRELRGRLEKRFGRPTQTLLDAYRERTDSLAEYIQFEYWLVVNDSIPVKIMDTGGPFDRSVVLATDERYRTLLPSLRERLREELTRSAVLETYVDYYYDPESRTWYMTGFDGLRYFAQQAGPPPVLRTRPRRPEQ